MWFPVPLSALPRHSPVATMAMHHGKFPPPTPASKNRLSCPGSPTAVVFIVSLHSTSNATAIVKPFSRYLIVASEHLTFAYKKGCCLYQPINLRLHSLTIYNTK
ncbi:unnamed protein product [Linum trigynum]|uniref:Uncharacterized protein n=1 Tax=Linum trigynum TaxID=586398 RepID=A0AAV2DJE8_9ROSI